MKANKTQVADRQRQPEMTPLVQAMAYEADGNFRDAARQYKIAGDIAGGHTHAANMHRKADECIRKTQPTAARTVAQVKYEFSDCGCYVDGSHGIYAIDAIVEFAEQHGFTIEPCNDKHYETCFESRFAGCEFAGEIEDEADDYMNANYPVDNAFWGRSEQGDWGLWESEG